MNIRHTQKEDLPRLLAIYETAREFMAQTGNPHQWGSTNPPADRVERDIEEGLSYAVEQDGRVCGVFALIEGDDPTYAVIDGAWRSDAPYATIHRIASDGTAHGILAAAVAFGLTRCPHLRIDTHTDNRVMQHLVQKLGFVHCGTIYLANGSPRLAYERI